MGQTLPADFGPPDHARRWRLSRILVCNSVFSMRNHVLNVRRVLSVRLGPLVRPVGRFAAGRPAHVSLH